MSIEEQLRIATALAQDVVRQAEQLAEQREQMAAALRKCLEVLPMVEVRGWPPGHRMKKEAIAAAQAALAELE